VSSGVNLLAPSGFASAALIEEVLFWVVRTSARVLSSTLNSRLVSKVNWLGLSSINKDWDDADVARQCCLNFQPHEVVRVIKAPSPVFISDRKPAVTDQCQQDIAGTDRTGNHLDEVTARRDGVDRSQGRCR